MFKQTKNLLGSSSSKVETIVKTGQESQPSRLSGPQRLKECGLILSVLLAMLLTVALMSFSPADPSWSQTAWGGEIENAGGLVGAWIADTLFFTFGSLAYPIPAIIVVFAWVTLRNRKEDEAIDLMLWGTRLLGLVIVILTSCGLADINFDDIWYFSSGGVIGDVLTSLALPTLNVLGTTLVLLFLWGAGVTLLTGVSWLTIVEWVGSSAIALFTSLINKLRGEQDEVHEPVLKEPAEDSVVQEVSAQQEPIIGDLDEAPSKEPRRFNIHMPESHQQDTIQPLRNQEAQVEEFTTETKEEKDIVFADNQPERVTQLGATIEELEAAALSADDMPLQEEPIEPQMQEHLEYASMPDPAALNQDNISNPQTGDLPWRRETVEDTESDEQKPMISEEILEQITEQVEPNQHVEPTISDIDTVDIEEVVEQPLSEEGSSFQEPVVAEPYEPEEEQDEDVQAFQSMVSDAQANMAAQQNPFLVQKEPNLPKPAEPMPTLELLYHPEKRENFIDRAALEDIARLVEAKLADYKIKAEVVDIFPGPVITRFELDLAPGVKVSRISGLSMDLARSLSAMAVRVVEVIPGKPYVA